MTFFETGEGRVHVGRIAGVLYLVALVPGCSYFATVDLLCALRVMFAVGWWLAFCEKQPARALAEMRRPHVMLGSVLILIGIVGQFSVVRHT